MFRTFVNFKFKKKKIWLSVFYTGTDRKIQYWECYDGSLIRDLEGSTAAAVNSLDVSQDGSFFVTGSNDFLVKVCETF